MPKPKKKKPKEIWKVRKVKRKLRVPKEVRRRAGSDEWARFQIVMPLQCAPLWSEIQANLRDLGVVHEDKVIEAGMHFEILMAEYWAGTQVPRPEGWIERVD